MPEAREIHEVRLEDGGVRLSLLNLGCITRGWWVPLGRETVPVVLGYADPAAYTTDPFYAGAIAGRVANRIRNARFTLTGETHALNANEGRHHLHGGMNGLNRRFWSFDTDGNRAVQFRYRSPDGEEGYPGVADISVTVTLQRACVTYEMAATVDRPTPISLAQHNYYTLGAPKDLRASEFTCLAQDYTPVGDDLLPTGGRAPVAGTPYDFRKPTRFATRDPDGHGIDLNFLLPMDRDPNQPVASVRAPNGLSLRMWSDQPGLQVYTGHGLSSDATAHPGQSFTPFYGLAIEPQGVPNAVNEPAFPSVIVTPETPYRQTLSVEIAEAAR